MTFHYSIADFLVRLVFAEGQYNSQRLIPSFERFRIVDDACCYDQEPLFTLTIDDTLPVVPKEQRHRIRAFDTGNGETIVDHCQDGGYQFIIKDLHEQQCALLISDKDFAHCRCALNGTYSMRTFGLTNVLMLSFAYASSRHSTLLMHASLVRHEGRAYAFTAKSGTGKSTHVSLWMQHIPHCDIMNDDNPIIRLKDDGVWVYGGPWSGKTPCYRNVKAPLGAVVRIDRATTNSIERLSPIEAFISVLPSCSSMKWDADIWDRDCKSVSALVEHVPCYTLHCLPDEEAAMICHNAIHTYAK